MKNVVAVDEFAKKLTIYRAVSETEKKQQQIELLSKEKVISQQQLQLSNQQVKTESFQKNILIGSVLVLLLLGFIIFRNINLKQKNEASRHELVEKEFRIQKMESEKIKIEIQSKAAELEMQALRAQMNPHFIFNCLNSINRFIINNDTREASDYLTRFAKLIRIVLQQSGKSLVSLEDELYCLKLYMDLEALRFEKPFQYEINCNNINTSVLQIPSLIIQPFVENSIWHGLHPKQNSNGKIVIDLSVKNNILHCTISDNGIGRKKAWALREGRPGEKESMGISLTKQRLQLSDNLKQQVSAIEIYDIQDAAGEIAGTCVQVKIPVKKI